MGKLFDINEKSSIPVWLQLKNRIIYLIESGYYAPGEQLPTVRGLAIQAEVNYNTISKVYMSLEQEGYIETRQRHGAFVCDVSKKPGVSVDAAAKMMTHDYIKGCFDSGMSLDDIEALFAQVISEIRSKSDNGRTKE